MRLWFTTKDPLADDRPRRLGFRRPLVALTALAAAGAIAAGCNSNSSGNPGSGGSSSPGGGAYGPGGGPPATGPSGAATVSAATSSLGQVLVDAKGRTLYLFQKDRPDQSACAGACAAAWPADHSAGTPKAAGGAKASLLGTVKRADGSRQVTYHQHPLYYYAGDSAAGQQSGQGLDAFGARWYVVAPSGGAVTSASAGH